MTLSDKQERQAIAGQRIAERNLLEAQKLAKLGSWELDLKTGDIFWSEECFRIWGYEPGSAEPSFNLFIGGLHPEDRQAVGDAVTAVIETKGTYKGEFRVAGADGAVRHVDARSYVTLDEGGAADRVIGYVQDITTRKQTEDALRAAKQRAEEASRAKTELLGRASHELRTPLNAILGFAQLLEMEVEKAGNKESVQHILDAGRHLLKLVDNVLDISRVEADHLALSLEPVHVGPVIETVLAVSRRLAASREITLDPAVPENCSCYVVADRERLERALLHLLSNAINYNHERGSVSLHCEGVDEKSCRITVRDTGPGLSPDTLARIFEPFNRGGAERNGVEGTGLGLTHAKALVEAMRGHVGVESTPGEGSAFWIQLPLAADSTPGADLSSKGRDGGIGKRGHTVPAEERGTAN